MTDPTDIDMETLFAEEGRISTFSVPDNCVEIAPMPDGQLVAVRNHNDPGQGHLIFPRSALHDLLLGVQAGELDDLV